jgi:NCS1 family nucleobase:cation symporter-1
LGLVVNDTSLESVSAQANGTADESAWPLLPAERTWSSWKLLVTLATAGAATWCYIIGGYAGQYLGFKQAFAATLAGCMSGMLMTTLAVVPVSIRFGVDSIASCVPQFGSRGWILPALLQLISITGWNCLLLIFFGKSAMQFLLATGLVQHGSSEVLMRGATVVACVIVFVVLLRGAGGVERVSRYLVAHVLVGIWLLYVLISRRWDELSSAVPVQASPDPVWNFTTGIEIGFSPSMSWWPYIGAMVRMVPNARRAAVPSMLGLGATVGLLYLIGIAGALVLRDPDPATWLRTANGPIYGAVALLFVTAANLGTTIAGVYCSAVGLRHYKVFARVPWPMLLAFTLAPVALIGVFIPNLFFDGFGTFLAFVGISFAPICGIQIMDYFFIRKRVLSIRAIFDPTPQGAYRYWGGVNPAAIGGMVAGCASYMYLLNPLSFESHWPYEWTTASIPALVVSGVTYWALTRLIVRRWGKGGYQEGRSSAGTSRL